MVSNTIPGSINEIKRIIALAALIITQRIYACANIIVTDANAKITENNVVRAHVNGTTVVVARSDVFSVTN